MNNKKMFIIILVITTLALSGWMLIRNLSLISNQLSFSVAPVNSPTTSSPTLPTLPKPTSTPQTKPSSDQTMKIYRNTEWGFEFQYPKDWVVKENTFGGYYSKFNVVARPTSGWYSQFPILINIVLPEFAERSFKNIEKITHEVIVDGVLGIKYQYVFEGSQETAIILPLGEYKIILGTDDEQYTEIFNQILASFKFLKTP